MNEVVRYMNKHVWEPSDESYLHRGLGLGKSEEARIAGVGARSFSPLPPRPPFPSLGNLTSQ